MSEKKKTLAQRKVEICEKAPLLVYEDRMEVLKMVMQVIPEKISTAADGSRVMLDSPDMPESLILRLHHFISNKTDKPVDNLLI